MNITDLNLSRQTEEQRMAQDNCIFLARVGSTMYGTTTENSDDDMLGIFMPTIDYVIGRKRVDTVEFLTNASDSGIRNKKGDIDYKFYSLTKWFHLAINNNPNILEILFSPQNCILHETDEWKKIRDNKELFLSLKSYHSFKGYAFGQMERLGIKSGNNTGRKDLIALYQYDCKMAAHTFRLYYECIQLLKEQIITMPLPDRKEILFIKKGGYPGLDGLEKLKVKAKELEVRCDRVYDESKLRHSPDHEGISKLQQEILISYWKKQGVI